MSLLLSRQVGTSTFLPWYCFALDEIWASRNSLVFSNKAANPSSSCRRISQRTNEWLNVNSKYSIDGSPSERFTVNQEILAETKWRPPEKDFIKINVDASFSDRGSFIGVVARNFQGIPLLLWTGRVKAESPIEAETLAVRRGICLAKIKQWHRVIVEGDCKAIMESLSEGNSSPEWKLMPIFEEIRTIATTFTCIFSWISRDRNSAADSLVKWAARSNFAGFPSFGELPTSVGNTLFSELI